MFQGMNTARADLRRKLYFQKETYQFSENAKGCYSEKRFTNNIVLIEDGSVPSQWNNILSDILSVFSSKKYQTKVLTFFMIKRGESKVDLYVSVSGTGNKSVNNEFEKKLTKLSNNVVGVHFIPFSENHFSVEHHDQSGDTPLDKLALFVRFMMGVTSNFDKIDFQEYQSKFSLTSSEIDKIKIVKEFISTKVFRELWQEYNKKNKEHPLTPIDYLVELVLKYDVIDSLNNMKPLIQKLYVNDIERDRISVFYTRFAKDVKHLQERIEISSVVEALKTIWHKLSLMSNFTIAQKLGHCAENNLVDYLKDVQSLLEGNDQRWIFSLKVQDQQGSPYQIIAPCEVCANAINEYFNNINPTTKWQETVGFIPSKVGETSHTMGEISQRLFSENRMRNKDDENIGVVRMYTPHVDGYDAEIAKRFHQQNLKNR